MEPDLLDLYRRGSAWSADKIPAALSHLSARSTCDGWDVRTLLNHILQIQRYFLGMAQGNEIALTPDPPDLLSDDPVSDFRTVRTEVLQAFGEPGAIERTGIALAVAFSDQLVHGWDLAISTRQNPTMPEGLADGAFSVDRRTLHRRGATGPLQACTQRR